MMFDSLRAARASWEYSRSTLTVSHGVLISTVRELGGWAIFAHRRGGQLN